MTDQRTPEVNSGAFHPADANRAGANAPLDAVAKGRMETLRRAQERLAAGDDEAQASNTSAPWSSIFERPVNRDTRELHLARLETMKRAQVELEIDLRDRRHHRSEAQTASKAPATSAPSRTGLGLPHRAPTRSFEHLAELPQNVNLDTRTHSEPTSPVAISELETTYALSPPEEPASLWLMGKAAVAAAGVGAIAVAAWWMINSVGDDSNGRVVTPIVAADPGEELGDSSVEKLPTPTTQAEGNVDEPVEEPDPTNSVEPDAAEAVAPVDSEPGTDADSDIDRRQTFRVLHRGGEVSLFGQPDETVLAEMLAISETILNDTDPLDRTNPTGLDPLGDTVRESLDNSGAALTLALTDPLDAGDEDEATPFVRVVAERLTRYAEAEPDLQLVITGHTDSLGPESQNQIVSFGYAEAFADLLVEAGMDPDRIGTAGMGEMSPIADNGLAGGREVNSRVEIELRWS